VRVIAAGGDSQHATHGDKRMHGLVRSYEGFDLPDLKEAKVLRTELST
jgi:hypothetical protein